MQRFHWAGARAHEPLLDLTLPDRPAEPSQQVKTQQKPPDPWAVITRLVTRVHRNAIVGTGQPQGNCRTETLQGHPPAKDQKGNHVKSMQCAIPFPPSQPTPNLCHPDRKTQNGQKRPNHPQRARPGVVTKIDQTAKPDAQYDQP